MFKFPMLVDALLMSEPSVLMPAPRTLTEELLRLFAMTPVLPCAAMTPLLVTLPVAIRVWSLLA